ncbi:MAG: ketoacyl-ACP synthase III [Chloroflexi bacterium]|nr:ketoacyl-ACP synthase III [Chloroflexota bacterium]
MNRYAHVVGWGMAVPEKVLTNDDLARMVDTTDEWIVSRTGIRERRIAGPKETTASLAIEAATRALEVADISPDEIDMIIVATSSPEHIFPSTASLVQDALGASRAGAFDLSAACSGFIYALGMATNSIKCGSMNTALVIGSETLSRLLNWSDRGTCILFGDGAGAFVLRGSDVTGGVMSLVMRSDGSGGDLLTVPAGGSKMPASYETVRDNLHTIQMDGRAVYRFATRVMIQSTREAVACAGLQLSDIDAIVPHQANRRIIEAAARGLELPEDKFVINVERYGNTSTASIPIALCEAVEKGRVKPNDHLVFVGFGAGLTWGASVVHWDVTPPPPLDTWGRLRRRTLTGVAKVRSGLRRVGRQLEGVVYGKNAPEGEEPPHVKKK